MEGSSPWTCSREKLAIFVPSFGGGGAERAMIVLAGGFVGRGYSVDLLLARAEGPYAGTVDGRVRTIDMKAPRVLLALPRLVRYLRAERPRVLLTTLDYANLVSLWAARIARVATRVIVLEQNTISITARHTQQLRQRLVPRLVRNCYPWADYVVGNSQGVAEDLAQIMGTQSGEIKVIFNPVVTPALFEKARQRPRHQWFQDGMPPVILGAGRLTPQKDFPTLIRAFADVRRSRPAHLMILGEGPQRAELEGLIADLGLGSCVELPSFAQNPYAYMAHSAVFVLSSRWEGLPTVLIEAMACGTRVVATDCPSGPTEILAGGRYGRLVPMQDAPSLAQAIAAALDGTTAVPPAVSWRRFELDAVVDQYLGLFTTDHVPAIESLSTT